MTIEVERDWECLVCGNKYPTENLIKIHMIKEHVKNHGGKESAVNLDLFNDSV